MCDYLRRVIFTPYRKGCGPSFTLTPHDAGYDHGRRRDMLRYVLRQSGKRNPIFDGSDFGCSPMHAIDSDDTVAALMTFLTLRPGDTDAEYFDNYTSAQLEFADMHAESLDAEVRARFGDR